MPTFTDLERDHLTHLRAECACGRVTDKPFRMLKDMGFTSSEDVEPRLRCSACGARPVKVEPWAQWMASGAGWSPGRK